MRRTWLQRLACPACRAPFDLDRIREEDDEVLEAFLVCTRCRDVRPVVGGVAALPADWPSFLRSHGNVYRRSPVGDPRMARFLYGTESDGNDMVPFAEVVERYGDLAPGGGPLGASVDGALESALEMLPRDRFPRGLGLDLGCGVGRGTFLLAERLGEAIGVDPSLARVRRARNVATTDEPFLVPDPAGGKKDVALDLTRLHREGTAFAVADAARLPFADATFDIVVVHQGRWSDQEALSAEVERVRKPRSSTIVP